jgi:uncharacterized protein (DUF433 family)
MMGEQYLMDRIVVSQSICHGKPRIAGTRVMVYLVLDLLAVGKTIEEITGDEYYPELTEDDVFACIAYASRVVQNDEFVPVE